MVHFCNPGIELRPQDPESEASLVYIPSEPLIKESSFRSAKELLCAYTCCCLIVDRSETNINVCSPECLRTICMPEESRNGFWTLWNWPYKSILWVLRTETCTRANKYSLPLSHLCSPLERDLKPRNSLYSNL